MPYIKTVKSEFGTADFLSRMDKVKAAARAVGIDAVLVTPGADLRYLTGYDAKALERLTCLVIPTHGDASIVVPNLEVLAALASPIADLGLPVIGCGEGQDPYARVADLLPGALSIAVDDHMWASKVLRLKAAMPDAEQQLAGGLIEPIRMRKDAREIAALRRAGAAIDRVHAQVPALLRVGRTEREVGRDIAELIISEGHVSVDFVIVAAGANGASPHHDVSDYVIQFGDAVVVDIGGTMPDGYCSDCTRMYAVGDPGQEYLAKYDILFDAQKNSREMAKPGVSAGSVDAAARSHLDEHGLGELFIHRTGHGIGMQTHEEPYIYEGNPFLLEPGMAFSIEPGFYDEGRFGARIEDIVVCTETGIESMNNQPHELVVVD